MINNLEHQIKDWPALNVVKFACVAMMLFIHAHLMLVTNDNYGFNDISGFFYRITDKFMFLGLFLTILPALAGYIFRINNDYRFKKTIKIAIFLSCTGFLMNIVVWGIKYTFSWNVLQFVGLSFIVIAFLMFFFSERAVFLLSLAAIFAAAPLRDFLMNVKGNYLIDIFIGNINRFIFWPFFPWFGVVGFGFLFAYYQLKRKNDFKFKLVSLLAGAALLVFAVVRNEISPSLNRDYAWSSNIFQPETGFVLATIGLFLVLFVLGTVFFKKINFNKYGIVNSYSKGILWIYVSMMFVNGVFYSLIKDRLPLNNPTFIYFFWMIFIFAFSWYVGAMSIKLLQEKKLIITLKKLR
ncbi:MAG: heparan-alpha-glucosaminide N-acetyltransferase domain-containing protein [Patescibacteria group bacterium]